MMTIDHDNDNDDDHDIHDDDDNRDDDDDHDASHQHQHCLLTSNQIFIFMTSHITHIQQVASEIKKDLKK